MCEYGLCSNIVFVIRVKYTIMTTVTELICCTYFILYFEVVANMSHRKRITRISE